jgi:NAD-dependent SIR2 family protein deacetylase
LHPDCRNIALLTGAGVSVASGIPDFRSPGGMYDTLKPELLTATSHQKRLMERDPTYVVSWDVFQHNACPYLEVRRPFILGTRDQTWKATIAHRFA